MQMDATAVVTLQRVGWADCAAQAPHGVLHSLLRSEVSAHMYGLPVVRAVIDLKWWSPYHMLHDALTTWVLLLPRGIPEAGIVWPLESPPTALKAAHMWIAAGC